MAGLPKLLGRLEQALPMLSVRSALHPGRRDRTFRLDQVYVALSVRADHRSEARRQHQSDAGSLSLRS